MQSFIDMLIGTPAWVWVLLAFLVFRGWQATRPGLVQPWRLAILPIIFTLLGIYGLVTVLSGVLPWIIWLVFLVMTYPMGLAMAQRTPVQAYHQNGVMALPGSWSTLILILCIFVSKYALGYNLAMKPQLAHEVWFIVVDSGVAGVVAGLFIGRFIGLMKKYKEAPGENLLEGGGKA
jgi:hypothetical protein